MTQFEKSVAAPALAPTQPRLIHGRHFVMAFIGIVTLLVAIGATGIVLSQQPRSAAPVAPDRAVTDGWLPSVTAANEARRLQAAGEAIDGWMPRLSTQGSPEETVDGWSVRYMVSEDD